MWGFFKRKRPSDPTVEWVTLGELDLRSGTILLADPMDFYDPIRVEGLPTGQYPVRALVIHYPEGGRRIAKIEFSVRPGPPDSLRPLGKLMIDSGNAVLVDAQVYERHWREVGPARIGHISTQYHREVARLIGREFGLKSRAVNIVVSQLVEPVPEDLESKITAFVDSHPKYGSFSFSIKTMNSLDRLHEALDGRLWAELPLDEPSGASLLAFGTGFSDGSYPVVGLERGGGLAGFEVEFIGPDQDKILEAFPILRQ